MKSKLLLIIGLIVVTNVSAQDPFKLFTEKDKTWRPSIFELYISQYAGIDVSKDMIDIWDLNTIEEEIKVYPNETTEDVVVAMKAVANGKKVFFFIENYVWGGLNEGVEMSASWQQNMPMCSGFYPTSDKCFQNEGINYHCGKKESAHPMRFIIMKN